jgi:hypothetical protein
MVAKMAIGMLNDAGDEQRLAHHLPHQRALLIVRHGVSK